MRYNITGGNRVTTGRQAPFCLFTGKIKLFAHIDQAAQGRFDAVLCMYLTKGLSR